MREIRGYVFVADFINMKEIFGRNVNLARRIQYENIRSNNMSPYENLEMMQGGMKSYKRDFKKVFSSLTPAELEMSIAETKTEADEFSDGDLIVIMDRPKYKEKLFLGELIPGEHGFCGLASILTQTDFRTFKSLNAKPGGAKYAAAQVHRQNDGAPVTIAKFHLRIRETK